MEAVRVPTAPRQGRWRETWRGIKGKSLVYGKEQVCQEPDMQRPLWSQREELEAQRSTVAEPDDDGMGGRHDTPPSENRRATSSNPHGKRQSAGGVLEVVEL